MRSNTLWQDIRQTFQRRDSAIPQLILFNVFVFLGINLVNLSFYLSSTPHDNYFFRNYIAVPSDLKALLFQPWTLLTYMFVHVEFMHILMNMLWLYWFGKIFAEFLGSRRLLPLYLLGGLTGAVIFIISFQLFPVFSTSVDQARLWGASASVLAIVVATATYMPDYPIFLFFFGPVKIKWVAIVPVALSFISIPQGNAGGEIAHLGGAAFGFIYARQLRRGNDWAAGLNALFSRVTDLFRGKPKLKVTYTSREKPRKNITPKASPQPSKQERIDKILDKISQSGYDALSKEEKDFLFNVSKEDK